MTTAAQTDVALLVESSARWRPTTSRARVDGVLVAAPAVGAFAGTMPRLSAAARAILVEALASALVEDYRRTTDTSTTAPDDSPTGRATHQAEDRQ